jgi:hypothetical protein
MAPQAFLSRHCGWRCIADAGPTVPTWQQVLRHWKRRCSFLCRATVYGTAKKGYSGEFFWQ